MKVEFPLKNATFTAYNGVQGHNLYFRALSAIFENFKHRPEWPRYCSLFLHPISYLGVLLVIVIFYRWYHCNFDLTAAWRKGKSFITNWTSRQWPQNGTNGDPLSQVAMPLMAQMVHPIGHHQWHQWRSSLAPLIGNVTARINIWWQWCYWRHCRQWWQWLFNGNLMAI